MKANIRPAWSGLGVSSKIIAAAHYDAHVLAQNRVVLAHQQAEAIVEAAHRSAHDVVSQAQDAAHAIRQEAFDRGVAQGQAECAAQLTAVLGEWHAYVQSLAPDLSDLVAQMASQYMNSAPCADRVAAAVRAGLASFEVETAVSLFVNPDAIEHVTAIRHALVAAHPLVHVLSIQADPALPLSSCRLKTPLGEHEAGEAIFFESLKALLDPMNRAHEVAAPISDQSDQSQSFSFERKAEHEG